MNAIAHPSAFIDPALTRIIRKTAPEAEQLRRLHPEQLSVIYAERWFNLFVPAAYYGLELSLLEGLKIEEGLAWADGSTGWTVTLCSGANWFIGFLAAKMTDALFVEEKVCLAGSGSPSGTARITETGYEITGRWDYATGAPFATAFTANCVLEKEGIVLGNADGNPLVKAFLFLKDEVVLHESWEVIGMIATASYSFEVKKLNLDSNRSFNIDSTHAVLSQPIYQYPFLQFAEATLAVNSSGMASRFLELCQTVFSEKAKNKLDDACYQLQQARQLYYTAVESSWDALVTFKSIAPEGLEQISKTSRSLAATARRLTDELFPYCGMIAANPNTEINRVWRNLHTASQHTLLTFPV
jgi:alkylation response protein AidB-like acyl-CoA dehydrogenase